MMIQKGLPSVAAAEGQVLLPALVVVLARLPSVQNQVVVMLAWCPHRDQKKR